MCSVAVFAPSRPSLRVRTLRRHASLSRWAEEVLARVVQEVTVNLAMGGSHSDDVPDTKGNMTVSRQSLFSWFNNHANLSSDENRSDSDENTQSTSFAKFLNASNGQEKISKLRERLVARNDDLGKCLYMVSEATQERADKVEHVLGSDPTEVHVAPTSTEIAQVSWRAQPFPSPSSTLGV